MQNENWKMKSAKCDSKTQGERMRVKVTGRDSLFLGLLTL